MEFTLKEILDFESGDSWNGTHYRDISVAFNKKTKTVEIVSQNELYDHEHQKASFTLDELKSQFDAAKGARYFGDFCMEAVGKVPGLKVEGATQGAFFKFVENAEFAQGAEANRLFEKPRHIRSSC